ncbi:MAG: glycosyltransferase family 2 protein [Bacteroidales bacterium]|nr:glycosyltransferase family 2 protein [Bacteroidales bacterium]
MYKDHKIGLLIPAYNEAENIGSVLNSIPDYVDLVLVVNDGSADNTVAIAREYGAEVISHKNNKGVGATFKTGVKAILATDVDIMVNMDADGQFKAADISRLLGPIIEEKADFVTASRFIDKDYIPVMPKMKKWGNYRMSRLISWLTGQKFYDVSCGFRAYKREVLYRMNLFGSFTYTQETFIDLAFKDIDIMEVPVDVLGQREKGKSRVASNLFRYAYQTSKIILKTFRDYKPFKLFGLFALIFLVIGILLLGIMFYHKLASGSFTPFKWLGFAGGSAVLISGIFLVLGFILDMFARMRHNQEEILFYLKNKNER